MKSSRVTFTNRDGVELSGRLDLPIDKKPLEFALFAHCFTCSKDLGAVKNISLALTSAGIAVLRFDFTGLGESGGEFAETDFSGNIEDLIDACKYLSSRFQPPSLLIGHSLGGAAVVFAANQLPNVKAVVTIGAPADPGHVSNLFEGQLKGAPEGELVNVSIGGRPFKMRKRFLEDVRSKNMHKELKSLRRALLIMHSPQDTIVGIDNAAEMYQFAMHPKSFITLDGADHLLSNKEDSIYAGEVIATWSRKYLEFPDESDLNTMKQVVVRTGESGFLTEVKAGSHRLLADEPSSVGGTDLGPSPYEFISIGLGACTAMTLRMYADRKKWPLKEVTVHLEHSKEHVEDMGDEKGVPLNRFSRILELEGDLDEGQRTRLLEIADKCPVHRTLEGPIVIDSRLSDH
jgi:putative redox protein